MKKNIAVIRPQIAGNLSFATIVFQCIIMKQVSRFKINDYLKATILPCFVTAILASFAFILKFENPTTDFGTLVINTLLSILWVSISVVLLGLNKFERIKFRNIIVNKLLKGNG